MLNFKCFLFFFIFFLLAGCSSEQISYQTSDLYDYQSTSKIVNPSDDLMTPPSKNDIIFLPLDDLGRIGKGELINILVHNNNTLTMYKNKIVALQKYIMINKEKSNVKDTSSK